MTTERVVTWGVVAMSVAVLRIVTEAFMAVMSGCGDVEGSSVHATLVVSPPITSVSTAAPLRPPADSPPARLAAGMRTR